MVAPTNTSEVQWKTNGLNPLSLRLRRQLPLMQSRGAFWGGVQMPVRT